MKKIILSVSLLLALTCCGKGPEAPSEPPCEHNYHIVYKTNPTEETAGEIKYQCGLCGDSYTDQIPLLNEENYTVTSLTTSCNHGAGHKYESETYGVYEITDNTRTEHSTYGGVCSVCNELVGEFVFKDHGTQTCLGYPRLYKLSEHWNNAWLLGGDNGRIMVRRSTDGGQSWSSEIGVSYLPEYSCANVDFFELANHDIICSYRAIGKDVSQDVEFNRKLHFSISHDGGVSWVDGGDIVDNYQVAESKGVNKGDTIYHMGRETRLGFFEPYMELINNVPTVVYADDFTPSIEKAVGDSIAENYKTQYLVTQTYDMKTNSFSKERRIIMNGALEKSVSNLKPRYSRDGMPVIAPYKKGYVMVFEGTYRDNDYFILTGETLTEYHPFEIMLSYSNDGISWSNPIEIYTPHNNNSKSSAPFVCVTDDDRLIISFQTDEDSVRFGQVGDSFSVMKCIISKPGVELEDLNQNSFYALSNPNNTPIGGASLWNGMMIDNGKLYTCSSGCKIRVSNIPIYDFQSLKDASVTNYDVRHGSIELNDSNNLKTTQDQTLVLDKNIDMSTNTMISTFVVPNSYYDCGIVFACNDDKNQYWEDSDSSGYYVFLINRDGYLILGKIVSGVWSEIVSPGNEYIRPGFSLYNRYKLSVKFAPSSGAIKCYVNGKNVFNTTDPTLNGVRAGFRSTGSGTIFSPFTIE